MAVTFDSNKCKKPGTVKLDEPFGSTYYIVLDDDVFHKYICMYDWWPNAFRYTQSKRVSEKVDWCTYNWCMTDHYAQM